MNRRHRIPALVVACSVALVASVALAGPLLGGGPGAPPPPDAPMGPPRGPHGFGGPEFGGPMHGALGELRGAVRFWDDEDLAAEIGLTAEQIAALEASYESAVSAAEALDGSVREAYKGIRDAVEADEPSLDAVHAAVDEATAAQAEAMKIALGHRVVVRNTLTPEQEEALRESRREHVGKRLAEARERFGPGGEAGARVRERMADIQEKNAEVRERVRALMEDGELSDADWTEIDAELRRAADERIEEIRERIRQLESDLDGVQGPPPPDGAKRRGPRGNG